MTQASPGSPLAPSPLSQYSPRGRIILNLNQIMSLPSSKPALAFSPRIQFDCLTTR